MASGSAGRRVAIVGGCRPPFCKAGTTRRSIAAADLTRHATAEVLHQKSGLDRRVACRMPFGQVVPSVLAPNRAREMSLLPRFPRSLPAPTAMAAVFGIGVPPFRGGPRRTRDQVGAAAAVETPGRLDGAYGPRFTPAPVPVRHGERGTDSYSTN